MGGIYDDETLDDLLIQGLKLIQKKKGFRFTLDSVLLGHFATVKEGDRAVDLGTGTGVIPFILSTRVKKLHIIGLEIQREMAEMAARSVRLNNLEEVIEVRQGDVREVHKKIGGGVYTLVLSNPPYWTLKEGRPSPENTKALARHEVACDFEDVVAGAGKLLNHQGRFAFIHCAERLPDLFALLRSYELEPRRIRMIHPFLDRPARHVLVEARKGAPAGLAVLPPLIVYEQKGRYTQEILAWYGRTQDGCGS